MSGDGRWGLWAAMGVVVRGTLLLAMALVVMALVGGSRCFAESPFVFRDVGDEAGLFPALEGIRGHGAGWGDVDGDGRLDLYVATFHTDGSKPNRLLLNKGGKFELDETSATAISTRGTGVIFVDLDNDGDVDLYVGSMPQPKGGLVGCALFRNDGGKFVDVSKECGACPAEFGGRSATALDIDGDGLLDLLVGEDPNAGYNGSKTRASRLFRNRGGLRFDDVTKEAGLPDVPGLGVAAADVNDDGRPDFFLASSGGGNQLFLNEGGGKFREAPGTRDVFAWKDAKGDNMVCGVCFADVNRDGRLDMVLGQHYKAPWQTPVANRMYLNRGAVEGVPRFEDVTERVGLVGLGMKSPHVELQDMDNDGWPDLVVSTVKFAGVKSDGVKSDEGKPHPVIFRHLGVSGGLPRFECTGWGVNDFPNDSDRAAKGTKGLFDKMVKEQKVYYTAPGPVADVDGDGRLDMFLPSWWTELRSLLLRNETPSGRWLSVLVGGFEGVNRQGIGARVSLYEAGKAGQASALLGCREIAVGYGYASGQPAVAHFGTGSAERVDVVVRLPHGKGEVVRKDVATNARLVVGR